MGDQEAQLGVSGNGVPMLDAPNGSRYKTAVGRSGHYTNGWLDKASRTMGSLLRTPAGVSDAARGGNDGAGRAGRGVSRATRRYSACVRHNQGASR